MKQYKLQWQHSQFPNCNHQSMRAWPTKIQAEAGLEDFLYSYPGVKAQVIEVDE